MRGVDDERNAIPLAYQLFLELVTARAGHLEIEHEARGRARPIRSRELLGRRKRRNGRSDRSEEPGERLPDRGSSSTTEMSCAWSLMGDTVSGPQWYA
jgi:hypothetical protein